MNSLSSTSKSIFGKKTEKIAATIFAIIVIATIIYSIIS